jgi:hypothetical protein
MRPRSRWRGSRLARTAISNPRTRPVASAARPCVGGGRSHHRRSRQCLLLNGLPQTTQGRVGNGCASRYSARRRSLYSATAAGFFSTRPQFAYAHTRARALQRNGAIASVAYRPGRGPPPRATRVLTPLRLQRVPAGSGRAPSTHQLTPVAPTPVRRIHLSSHRRARGQERGSAAAAFAGPA